MQAILQNTEVIAVNQDAWGRQGRKISASNGLEVWARFLSDYTVAVILYNNNPVCAAPILAHDDVLQTGPAADITVDFESVGFATVTQLLVRVSMRLRSGASLTQHRTCFCTRTSASTSTPSRA